MKNIVLFLLIVVLLGSCREDMINGETEDQTVSSVVIQDNLVGLTEVEVPGGITSVDIYNWSDNSFLGSVPVVNGHVWIGSNDASMTVKLFNKKSSTRSSLEDLDLDYIKDATIYRSGDNVVAITSADPQNSGYSSSDFLNIFPAGLDNRNVEAPQGSKNFEHDVLYISNGLPFSIYPIYSLGWYDLTLGMFYYDSEGSCHEFNFWDMKKVDWKQSYQYLSDNRVTDPGKFTIDKTQNASGYQITIPEGYVFGFYILGSDDSRAGKFYSYSQENKCSEKHSVNIEDSKGINYLAFEDQDNGDWDINDLICYVEPTLPVIPNPNEVKKKEAIENIPSTIIIPEGPDKIVHSSTPDSCDIEARYDGKGHDYVRISVPLKKNKKLEIDLKQMNQYCESDDFRIVTRDDVETLYCPDGMSMKTMSGEDCVEAQNDCSANTYNTVTAEVSGRPEDGVYQVKITLYPKSEETFTEIIKYLDNKEWGKLFKIKWTPN